MSKSGKLKINKERLPKTKKEQTSKDAIQESKTEEVVLQSDEKKEEQEVGLQEVGQTHEEQKTTDKVEEVTIIEDKEEIEKPKEVVQNTVQVPENLEKVVSFMNETGGNLEDYVRLNADYSNVDEKTLLREYYKSTKPHLDVDEINFILSDKFSYDKDVADDREIKKKNLAMKEEIAKAKTHLVGLKDKYYEEIKLRSNVTKEQQEALNFFNRYKESVDKKTKQHSEFVNKTKNYFSSEFEGFDFNVGNKKFRYKVSNVDNIVKNQSDVGDFLKTFLDEDGNVTDTAGYHKAIYSAKNIDKIANHFYEQGKADGVKNITANANNITTEARKVPNDTMYLNGLRVKAINGVDTSKLKIKKRK